MVPHSTGARAPEQGALRPTRAAHLQSPGPPPEAIAPEPRRGALGERGFREWLAARLGEFLQRSPGSIDPRTPFAEYGLDSVAALSLYGDIEDEFALYLEPTVAWDHPTIEELARYLAREHARLVESEGPPEV